MPGKPTGGQRLLHELEKLNDQIIIGDKGIVLTFPLHFFRN